MRSRPVFYTSERRVRHSPPRYSPVPRARPRRMSWRCCRTATRQPRGAGKGAESGMAALPSPPPPKAESLDLALHFQIDPMNEVESLVAHFGGTVEYIAPHWGMAQLVVFRRRWGWCRTIGRSRTAG